jgi:gliding motility-associated-like protein
MPFIPNFESFFDLIDTMKKLAYLLVLSFLSYTNSFAQTFSFASWTSGSASYSTTSGGNTMTAAYTEFANHRANTLANTDCFGTNTTRPAVPFYYNSATMYIADYSTSSCYCSSSNAQSGLVLTANWPDNNASRFEQVVLTFANPVCGPVTFRIWDINRAIWSGDGSHYFTDVVDISATDPASNPIAASDISITNCGSNTITTSGSTKTISAVGSACTCNSHNISIAGSSIKTITIRYRNGGATYSNDPSSQYIIITNIVASAAPTASITATPLACGSNSTTLSVTTNASSPTYAWSGTSGTSITSPSASNTAVTGAGTYTVTVNPGSCSTTATYTLTPSGTPPDVNINPPATLTCSNTSVTLTATSATPGVTYAWSGGGTGATKSVSSIGTYTVTATAAGCSATASATVSQNTVTPNVSIAPPAEITCTNSSVTLTASSTTSGATFAWSGGGTGATKSVSTAGSYTVTATDPSNGCRATASRTVTQNTIPPNVSAGADKILLCNSASVTLDGSSTTAGATFSWSNGLGSNATATAISAGTYTLTATNPANGCTASAQVNVTLDTNVPISEAGANQSITCTQNTSGIIQIGSSPTLNYTYAWSPAAGLSVNNIANPMATPTATTTYSVTTTNTLNGCTSTDAVTITIDTTTPNANVGLDKILFCGSASVTLDGSSTTPSATFSWSNGLGNNDTVTAFSDGVYTLTVTNSVNGCSATDQVAVTLDVNAPLSDAGQNTSITCITNLSGAVTIGTSSTPNFSYEWSPSAGLSQNNVSNPVATSTTTTIYTVTTTNILNGCTSSDAVTITVDRTPPNAEAGNSKELSCTITTVTLDGSSTSPNVSYAWSNSLGNTATVNTNLPGNFTLTVTDNINGCSATDQVVISQNINVPDLNILPPADISCTNPVVTITSVSSTANVIFNWSEGSNIATQDVSVAGQYSVTATDNNNGCTASRNVSVSSLPAIDFSVNANAASCGNASGSASVSIISGNGPFDYAWSNGAVTASIVNLNGGQYAVTVTDANGCSDIRTVIVGLTPQATKPDIGLDSIICEGDFVVLFAGNYDSYLWQDGTTVNIYNATNEGVYIVTVTDSNGCEASDTMQISFDEQCGFNLVMPTAFSPNQDGKNDTYKPVYTGLPSTFEMRIFNRWGEKVFETDDITKGWDGKFKGTTQPMETYVWTVSYTYGQKVQKSIIGNLALLY